MNEDHSEAAPKSWTGRFLEDLTVGDIYRSRVGRTVIDADNIWFTCLTMNTNQVHFNSVLAQASEFDGMLVNSTFTLALVSGLSVADVSENAIANLGWQDVTLPAPVFVGDTIWAETEVLELRDSTSRPGVGIVKVRTRGTNQRSEIVIVMTRTFMLPRRGAGVIGGMFPQGLPPWD